MNLNNFESYINPLICQRGLDYYQNGNVAFVKETDKNVYVAEVIGTETYTVEIELDDDLNIIEAFCDCPYDWGEYCKHEVAVFLTLKELEIKKSSVYAIEQNAMLQQAQAEQQGKRKNSTSDVENILSARTKEELIAFLLQIANEEKEIKQRILLEFSDDNDEERILHATSLIRTYIRNNSDQHEFVNYMDTFDVVYGAELVLDKAKQAWEDGKVVHAVNLTLCVVREMVDLIQNADDSSGIIGGMIEDGFEFMDEIIENTELSSSEKNTLFESLIKEASHRRYDDWTDWRLNFFEMCSLISDKPDLRNKLEKQMVLFGEKEDVDSWNKSYYAEKVSQIRYNMILLNDGEEKAQEFLEQNLHFSSFRKMKIEQAIQRKDYEEVIKLTLEGEEKDKGLPGLVNYWRECRYQAYKLAGKLDEQRKTALDFILDGSFEYYKELKNTYQLNEWGEVYPRIIFSLENQEWIHADVYTQILIEEGEKEKLLKYVQNNFPSVESYYEYLIPEFKEEVYDLFLKHIEQTASRASKRRDYQKVCAIIRNLIKAGGRNQALMIIQKFFIKYANKPAFKDELTKIKI